MHHTGCYNHMLSSCVRVRVLKAPVQVSLLRGSSGSASIQPIQVTSRNISNSRLSYSRSTRSGFASDSITSSWNQTSLRKMSQVSASLDAVIRPVRSNQDQGVAEQLWANARTTGSSKALDSRVVFPSDAKEPVNVLVSLGKDSASVVNGKDENGKREVLRKAYGTGVKKVKELVSSAGLKNVGVVVQEGEEAVAGKSLPYSLLSLPSSGYYSKWT